MTFCVDVPNRQAASVGQGIVQGPRKVALWIARPQRFVTMEAHEIVDCQRFPPANFLNHAVEDFSRYGGVIRQVLLDEQAWSVIIRVAMGRREHQPPVLWNRGCGLVTRGGQTVETECASCYGRRSEQQRHQQPVLGRCRGGLSDKPGLPPPLVQRG